MTMSSYPGGFKEGALIRNIPVHLTNPGKVFFVGNSGVLNPPEKGASNNNDGTFYAPWATLDYAVGRCLANRGDVIFVKPGHTETISSATALALDVAGIAIVGLGTGSLRPTFTLDTANTATIAVSAANISIKNCLFVGNFLSIATLFTLSTAREFTLDSCEFRDTSATLGFLTIVTTNSTANAADGLTIVRCKVSSASTSATALVIAAGAADRVTIEDNFINHTGATNNVAAVLEHGALVLTNVSVQRNKILSVNTDTATGGLIVKTTATTGSGIVADNYAYHLDVAGAILVTAAAVQYGLFNNLTTGDTGTSGYVLPAIGGN